MRRKYGYLVVEGPHDVEFAYRLLSPFGFKRVRFEKDLDSFFASLIPRNYPPDGDLQKRMSIPLFLQNDTHAIAIHSAIGDSRLVGTVEENASLIDLRQVTGIGILLDSDKQISAQKRYAAIKQDLANIQLVLEEQPGLITQSSPRLGAFVLPDNLAHGTLEDLLLESANLIYPELLAEAKSYVDRASNGNDLIDKDLEDFKKPAGRNKAVIGAMANILRPGKAVQTSIQDNRWLRGEAFTLPCIQKVQDFLKSLFEIP